MCFLRLGHAQVPKKINEKNKRRDERSDAHPKISLRFLMDQIISDRPKRKKIAERRRGEDENKMKRFERHGQTPFKLGEATDK